MFQGAHTQRLRPALLESASEWPEPNETTLYSLPLMLIPNSYGVEALLEAMQRPDIDTLSMQSDFCRGNIRGALIQDLLSLDREWSVSYTHRDQKYDLAESLKMLDLFKYVHYLQLDYITEEMIPLLKSFPRLRELDLSDAIIHPRVYTLLCQEDGWAEKIPHITLAFRDSDTTPIQFPPTSGMNLRSFQCSLEGTRDMNLSDWIYQASQLQGLRHLSIYFKEAFPNQYPNCIRVLSTWISSPCCQITHFSIEFTHNWRVQFTPDFISEHFLPLITAIGQNHSIQELYVKGLHSDGEVDWSNDVFPHLSKSSVHRLDMDCGPGWKNNPYIPLIHSS